MNNNYQIDIQEFIDYTEGKVSTIKSALAMNVYKRYQKRLKDIDVWPEIFGNLYDGIWVFKMGNKFYSIDGVHDCFPKAYYSSITDLYQSHQPGIKLTLRSVWENFYKRYEWILEEYYDYVAPDSISDDQVVSDFYDVMFKGADPKQISPKAYKVYCECAGKNIYDIEIWPDIFDKLLEKKFISISKDGYRVLPDSITTMDYFPFPAYSSFEEVYREKLGWEEDVLDFMEVYKKFYKYYISALKELPW